MIIIVRCIFYKERCSQPQTIQGKRKKMVATWKEGQRRRPPQVEEYFLVGPTLTSSFSPWLPLPFPVIHEIYQSTTAANILHQSSHLFLSSPPSPLSFITHFDDPGQYPSGYGYAAGTIYTYICFFFSFFLF